MKPIKRKIVVKINEAEEITSSGVIIPVSNRKENEAVVLFVSDHVSEVSPGDTVRFYPQKNYPTFEYEGQEVVIMDVDRDVELVL